MARSFDGLDDYLRYSDGIGVILPPATLFAWAKPINHTYRRTLVGVFSSTYASLWLTAGGGGVGGFGALSPMIFCSDGTKTVSAMAPGVLSDNEWHSYVGVLYDGVNAAIFCDGVKAAASSGANPSPWTPTNTTIGWDARIDAPPQFRMYGGIACVAVWNVALTDDEAAMLATGVWPPLVRPNNLVAFWPLMGASPEQDIVGGHDMTPYNGPTVTDNPRILMPPRRRVVYYSIPVGRVRRVFLTGGMCDLAGGIGGA